MAKILIVDDSFFIRNRLAAQLGREGYETAMASDGAEAVSAYRMVKPDIVLLDVTMPRKSGLEALFEIRKADPDAKIIMLTALDQPTIAAEAIRLGAKDFLAKPVDHDRLVQAIRRALK
ncbi:MAG: response regulator [Anaerolineae bacterium]|nr:response regulator [Anaerolineae bacterium]